MTQLLRTHLYNEHVKLGAKIVPFAGWDMPVQYTSVKDEALAVRNSAGVFDVSHMGEFFLDDLWRYEAAWMVPTPEVQTKLLALLQNEPRAIALHHKAYSIVSYAWSQKYQQSNQWAIETLAMALSAPAEPGAQGAGAHPAR